MWNIVQQRPVTSLLSLFVLIGLIFGITVIADPIKRLAIKLSFEAMSGSPWQGGFFNFVDLPSSAEPQDVVSFPNLNYGKVIKVERIIILEPTISQHYFGALVEDHDHGKRILIFWYEPHTNVLNGREGFWEVKNYDAN